MIYPNRFCCICLNKQRKLEKLSIVQENNLSYYDKLSVLIPQVDNNEIKDIIYLCDECKICIDNMYDFRNRYIRNNTKLRKYISKLRLNNFVDSTELDKMENIECVDNTDFDDNNDMIEFELIDYDILPTNELNNEQLLMNNNQLNIDIKQEISDDDLYADGNEICEYVIIKDENASESHTELSIECITKEVSNNKIEVQDEKLDDSTEETDVDSSSEKNETALDKPSDNISNINSSRNNNSSDNNNKTDVRLKPFKCDICSRSFNRKFNLNTHIQLHSGIKPYKCEVCNKPFTKLSHVKEHNKIHTGEKPHKCEICNKSFINTSILKIHIRTHTGEKPYKCKICGSVFPSSSILNRHNRIHSGERPYKCEVCDKRFTFNYDLKKHIRIHTGEKPYKCDICNKSFTNNYLCRRHMRVHTGEKPYKCDKCNKCFNHSTQLKKHCKTHSGE